MHWPKIKIKQLRAANKAQGKEGALSFAGKDVFAGTQTKSAAQVSLMVAGQRQYGSVPVPATVARTRWQQLRTPWRIRPTVHAPYNDVDLACHRCLLPFSIARSQPESSALSPFAIAAACAL